MSRHHTPLVVVALLALTGSAGAIAATPDLDAQVAEVIDQVEQIRGLEATGEIAWRLLDAEAAMADRRAAIFDDDELVADLNAASVAYERLGLLPPGSDLLDVTVQALDDQVAGYYDTETEQLTVIDADGELDTLGRLVLAHEVMHAIQDDTWDLDARIEAVEADDDRLGALQALVEGEATQLMTLWLFQHAMDDAGAIGEVPGVGGGLLDTLPPVVQRALLFPYLDGAAFVLRQWGTRDWAGVDQLWESPPASTEQVMHPERYPDDLPVTVELPDLAGSLGDGWATGYETTMGELNTGVWVADGAEWDVDFSLGGSSLPNGEAAEGWGGDHLVSLDGPGGAWAVAWQSAWDKPEDAAEFVAAAEAAMADLPGAHAVLAGTDLAGGLPSPVLVLVADDQATLDQLSALAPTAATR